MEIVTNTGTEIKVAVSLECAGKTMDDFNFVCDFYTRRNQIARVMKSDMHRESESTYIAVVDTSLMPSGTIMMSVNAQIPDSDCADGMRTEKATICTNINIKR